MVKTLKDVVSNYRKQRGLSLYMLANLACTSNRTVASAEKGEFDGKDFSKSSRPKRVAVAGVIFRLAQACNEEPAEFLKNVGLEKVTPAVNRKFESMSMPLRQDDLEYLLTVLKGLQQPITLGIAIELLKRRKPSSM